MAKKIDNSKPVLRLANFLGCSALRLILVMKIVSLCVVKHCYCHLSC
jgi:hypothetical protein